MVAAGAQIQGHQFSLTQRGINSSFPSNFEHLLQSVSARRRRAFNINLGFKKENASQEANFTILKIN